MNLNPIIFKDAGGLGVQLGDQRVYVTEDLMDGMHGDYVRYVNYNAELKEEISELKKNIRKLSEVAIRYEIICDLVRDLVRDRGV